MENERKLYTDGLNALKANEKNKARMYFESIPQGEETGLWALYQLIQLNVKEGKYASARDLLEQNKDSDFSPLHRIYGRLECIEYNFKASQQHFEKYLENQQEQKTALLFLANLYVQKREYQIAEKMFQTLQLDPAYMVRATLNLVYVKMIEKDYHMAYRYLEMIDSNSLSMEQAHYYCDVRTHLLCLIGKKSQIDFSHMSYRVSRLFARNDNLLLEHVSKHLCSKEQSDGFFPYTDLKKLLYDVRNKIETMHADYDNHSNIYRCHLDAPIGFIGNQITNDICVVTILERTDVVVTMYPVLLSDQFDQEQNAFKTYTKKKGGK